MRMLGYYLFHTFINQIKKLCKSWFIIFMLVCMLMGGIIGFVAASLEEEVESTQEEITEIEEIEVDTEIPAFIDFSDLSTNDTIELIVTVAIACIIVVQILNADKSGGKLFLPADTTLLFSSPLRPQSVLLFRIFAKAGAWLFTLVYLLTFMPTWLSAFEISYGTMIILATSIVYAFFFGNFLMVMFYTFLSTNPKYKKSFQISMYTILFLILGFILFYQRTSNLSIFSVLVRLFNNPIARCIPIWGWLKGFVRYSLEGNMLLSLVYLCICILFNVLLIYVIWHMKADFYEEALSKSQETAALQEMMQSENVGFVKRKKDRSDKIKRDGFHYGFGSNVFFYRTIYNRLRFAPFGIFTKTTITYLLVSVGLFVLSMIGSYDIDIVVLILLLSAFTFYRTLGDAWAEDASKDFFRMIPSSTSSKIFYSLLGGSLNCLLDLLPALIVGCILLKANPLTVLAWIPFILSIHFYGIAVNAFVYTVIPTSIGAVVKQVIQVMFLYFGLLPAIGILAFGYIRDWFTMSILIATTVHIVLASIFIYLTAESIEPSSTEALTTVQLSSDAQSTVKKTVSRIGIAFVIFLVVGSILQIISGILFRSYIEDPIWMWVIQFTPLYAIAFPLSFLYLRKLPSTKIQKQNLSPLQFIKVIFISYAFMYAGNMIGSLITLFFSTILNSSGDAAIVQLATSESIPMKILVMVICAPVFEELLCRKYVIDKTIQYGERNSILLSGLLFGLFHGNFTQFFYAYLLGIVFAYVYVRTGKLRYSIILHMMINFMGSIIAPEIIKTVDPVTQISVPYIIYIVMILCFAFIGLLIWVRERKHLTFKQSEQELSKQDRKYIYINPGMICFYCVCLVFFVISIFA